MAYYTYPEDNNSENPWVNVLIIIILLIVIICLTS